MINFKKEFLRNYYYIDLQNHSTDINAEDEDTNGIKEQKLIDKIYDYALKNNLYSDKDWETIGGVFNNVDTLKIEIHNLEKDTKRYIYI